MKKRDTDWEPTRLVKIRDGFYLLVEKSLGSPRWRYSVTILEYVERPMGAHYRAVRDASARGYMRSRERAVGAADAACDGLVKAMRAGKLPVLR